MAEQIQISAKNLGELALPDFCPRCFWIKRKVKKLPYQIFPGIFSSIDSYTKKVVHGHFDTKGTFPPWLLTKIEGVTGYINPPSYHRFQRTFPKYNIKLTGAADAIFVRADGSHVIADYKTAKYTANADKLMPIYVAQLNAYAVIAEEAGPPNVSALGLLYMEPITDEEAATQDSVHNDAGFSLGFSANFHAVELTPDMIEPLLRQTREIYDLPKSPPPREGCKECMNLASLIELGSGI